MKSPVRFALEHWKEAAGFAGGGALLAFVLATSDLGKVARGFERFSPRLVPVVFGLIAAREAVRVVEWRLLLRHLGVRARWRHSLIALLGGDAAQLLPGGIYVSNLVLKREEEANVARSLAATAATQLLEVFVCLVVLTAVGVRGWPWMRPVAAVVLAGFCAFLFTVTRPGIVRWLRRKHARQRVMDAVRKGLTQFLQGMEGLLDWSLLATAGALATAHLAFTVAALYVIALGLQISVDWAQVAAVYAFVLALVNLNPLPTDIGVSEASGTSIFVASGVDQAQGLTAMLLVRFAVVVGTALLLMVVLMVLPREVKHLIEGPNKEDAIANAAAERGGRAGVSQAPPLGRMPAGGRDN